MHPPPPPDNGEGMDPTIAFPRIETPPPRPRVEYGVSEPPSEPVRISPAPIPPAGVPAPAGLPPHPIDRTGVLPYAAPPPVTPSAEPQKPRFVFGNPVGYTFARFVAFAIDLGLISVVVTALAYALVAINPLTGLPNNNESGFDATLGLGVIVALIALWLSEAMFGTTVGKLAVGLHVYTLRGGFVGLGRSFVRNVLLPVDVLVIGWILALLPGHRRLGDYAGGTVVARSPLRAFAPLVGWILIIVLAGLPFLIIGTERTFAAIVAFGEFVPALIWRAWTFAFSLFGGAPAH
ncbi:MAG: hypothetical protein NVS3B7_11670 [Candidatus Elarobacter sp.]